MSQENNSSSRFKFTRIFTVTTKRPIAILMIVVAVVVFGWVSYTRLPVNLMPDISYPSLTVRTEYEGASPYEVESAVSIPIEQALGVLDNLESLSSVSKAGISDVMLEFSWNTDMNRAVQDVRESLDQLFLPDETERPLILRYDPSLDPVMILNLSGKEDMSLLRDLADNIIKRKLEAVPGIAAVKVKGGLERQIKVEVDENKLSGLSLNINDISSRLVQENINVAGGNLKEGATEYIVRTLSEFRSIDEIGEIIISRRGEASIRLKDISTISDSYKDKETINRLNGRESVEIEIYKEADANIVTVAQELKKHIFGSQKEISKKNKNKHFSEKKKRLPKKKTGTGGYPVNTVAGSIPEGTKIRITSDQSGFVVDSIREVKTTAIFGGFLAIFILYIFLRNFTHTAIIGVAIPVSIVATFAPMNLWGVSLNIMSLGGLALGIGMLVDNSIVVLESIFRCREEGDDFVDSVIRGTGEVGGAVVASTLTTIAVFFPIIFVEGVAGQVFGDMGLTVVFSLLASLGAALFLIPMLASRKAGETVKSNNPFKIASDILLVPVRELQSLEQFSQNWQKYSSHSQLCSMSLFRKLLFRFFALLLLPFHLFFETTGKLLLICIYIAVVPVLIPMNICALAILAASGKTNIKEARIKALPIIKEIAFTPYRKIHSKIILQRSSEENPVFIRALKFFHFIVFFLLEISGKVIYVAALVAFSALFILSLLAGLILYTTFRFILFPVINSALSFMNKYYPIILAKALNHNGTVLILSFTLLALSLLLLPYVGTELIPEVHQGSFNLELTLPVGTPLEITDNLALKAEEIVLKDKEVDYVSTSVGSEKESLSEGSEGEHTALLNVAMKKGGNLKIREQELIRRLRKELELLPDVDMKFSKPAIFSFKTPIEVEIKGYHLGMLKEISDIAVRELKTIEGLSDVKSNIRKGNPEIQILYDRNRLSQFNLDIYNVASIVKSKIKGSINTEFKEAEKSIDIMVTLNEKDRNTVADLKKLVINPGSPHPVALASVANIIIGEGPNEIRRIDQQRTALITSNISGFDLGTASAKIEEKLKSLTLPEGFSYSISGQSKEMMVSLNSLRNALLLAIFLVYIVMASQFESIIHPLVILFSIPMAITGVIVMLVLTGTSMSIVVFLGLIMLSGIVVNNAIVLVDYINHLVRGGMDRKEAVILAGTVRLRPILMTTATTVLGLLPMALGLGEGAEIRTPMALTVIAGLISSTILTLIVIPSFYSWVESVVEHIKKVLHNGSSFNEETK